VDKAFIQNVIQDFPEGALDELDDDNDKQPLVYKTFLAAPYITRSEGCIQEKWSGTNEAGDNTRELGCVIDAFTHHSLVDSNHTAVIVDLQGMPHITSDMHLNCLMAFQISAIWTTKLSFLILKCICMSSINYVFSI
jgi:hypothetical protein